LNLPERTPSEIEWEIPVVHLSAENLRNRLWALELARHEVGRHVLIERELHIVGYVRGGLPLRRSRPSHLPFFVAAPGDFSSFPTDVGQRGSLIVKTKNRTAPEYLVSPIVPEFSHLCPIHKWSGTQA